MNTIRLFIGCKLSRDILGKSLEIQEGIKKLDPDVKWVSDENIHLTLKFLGHIKSEIIEDISRKLQVIARNHDSFDLSVEGVGVFPRLSNPKVIWIGSGEGSDKLRLLEKNIENALSEFNLPKEEREYVAHITLGRVRSPKNKEKIAEYVKQNANLFMGNMEVKYFTLFQSQLSRTGPVYTDLKTFMLKTR